MQILYLRLQHNFNQTFFYGLISRVKWVIQLYHHVILLFNFTFWCLWSFLFLSLLILSVLLDFLNSRNGYIVKIVLCYCIPFWSGVSIISFTLYSCYYVIKVFFHSILFIFCYFSVIFTTISVRINKILFLKIRFAATCWHKHPSNPASCNADRRPAEPMGARGLLRLDQSPASPLLSGRGRGAGRRAGCAAIDALRLLEDTPGSSFLLAAPSPRPSRAAVMVSHSLALPMICFTALWALVGVVAPFLVPKGPNRGWVLGG